MNSRTITEALLAELDAKLTSIERGEDGEPELRIVVDDLALVERRVRRTPSMRLEELRKLQDRVARQWLIHKLLGLHRNAPNRVAALFAEVLG